MTTSQSSRLAKTLLATLTLSLLPILVPKFAQSVSAATVGSGSCQTTVDSATGVTIIDSTTTTGYCIIKFTTVGPNTWTPPAGVTSIEYLIVAGGGGGASGRGGGGGAGGFETGTVSVSGAQTLSVGAGGAGGTSSGQGGRGSNTSLASRSVTGGGGGGQSFAGSWTTGSGGSGGGAGIYIGSSSSGTAGGNGISGQGNSGGGSGSPFALLGPSSPQNSYDFVRNSAGGGGAGGSGVSGQGGSRPGDGGGNAAGTVPQTLRAPDGGPGLPSTITGTLEWFAGGGGGSAGRFNTSTERALYYTAGNGAGGIGGGGAGSPETGTVGVSGTANTGGGGGAGGFSSDNVTAFAGGAGGSGIVIIRYLSWKTVTATGPHATPSICNQTVSDSTSVIAYRLTGGDCIIEFRKVGGNVWKSPTITDKFKVLVVGGGGGGGSEKQAGGGGGGTVMQDDDYPNVSSSYSLTIGSGGNGGWNATQSSRTRGASGGDSIFDTYTAKGGGGGGGGFTCLAALSGGSGGGGGSDRFGCANKSGGTSNQTIYSGWTQYYNSGASGDSFGDGGGGGGGAGSVGGPGAWSTGGSGVLLSITESATYYGAGGGGYPFGAAGTGGGGSGGTSSSATNMAATSGTTFGSGGGGGGGSGFQGIIIIRYTPDTTAPSLISAVISNTGTTLTLTFDETLSATTAGVSRFTLTRGASETITVNTNTISGSTAMLALGRTIAAGQSLTISYTDPTGSDDTNALQDSFGNDVATFTNISVTNNSSVLNPLTTPTTLAVSSTETNTATFTFTNTTNASSHTLRIYDSATATLRDSATSFTSGSTRTGLTPATQYYATLQAVGDGITYESSTASSPLYFTTAIRKPVIASQPSDTATTTSRSATFAVTATSPDTGTLSYQWQRSSDGGSTYSTLSNGAGVSGVTTATLTLSSLTTTENSYRYRVVVTNTKVGVTSSETSTAATLTVNGAISLTGGSNISKEYLTVASSTTISASGGTGTISFTISGSTAGISINANNGVVTSDETTPRGTYSLTITATDQTGATATQAITVTITQGVPTLSISLSATPKKGTNLTLTATTSVAGTVRFLERGRVISGCKSKTATGPAIMSLGSRTATCTWKPRIHGASTVSAILTPTSADYSSTTTRQEVVVLKRSASRS